MTDSATWLDKIDSTNWLQHPRDLHFLVHFEMMKFYGSGFDYESKTPYHYVLWRPVIENLLMEYHTNPLRVQSESDKYLARRQSNKKMSEMLDMLKERSLSYKIVNTDLQKLISGSQASLT